MSRNQGLKRLLRPRSIAIVGASTKNGAAAKNVLDNVVMNNFAGDLYLVGRGGGAIEGRPILKAIADLPETIDLAILSLPAAAVEEALTACTQRKVGAVVIFASGFAEAGEREAQQRLTRIAADAGMMLLGPNCFGFTDYVHGFHCGFGFTLPVVKRDSAHTDPAIAIISQSGSMAGYARTALECAGLPTSYVVSTGNEAGLSIADFVAFFADDVDTTLILVYAEEVRDPRAFLAAAARARDNGKAVVVFHPGTSAKAKASIQSHTGALASDYAIMSVQLAHAGVVLAQTLEEWVDVAVLLARFPDPPQKGLGVISFSGAFCAFAHDHCERLALELPRLSPATEAKLSHSLPEFVPAQNPLDLGTQPFWQPELCRIAAEALTDDSAIGSILVALNGLTPQWSEAFVEALKDQRKPVVISVPNTPVAPEIEAAFRRHNIALMRSHERSLAAISRVTAHGRSLMRRRPVHADEHKPTRFAPAEFGAGPLPEWKGKELLRGLGFQVPDGKLVGTFEDAETFFNAVRRPVALKAQSATLPHKSDVGGVILALSDRPSLREGWNRLHENLATFAPEAVLDGVLIEAMAPSGIEFILGARREPRWGPVLSIGLGGVWAEALRDVKLMPCDLTPDEIAAELAPLRCAPLLSGFRGGPPADVTALSGAASILGALMLERPEIAEIDINPLIVHPDGQGVTVADVLIVSYPAG